MLGNFERQRVRMLRKRIVVIISHYISIKSHAVHLKRVLFKEARSSVKNDHVTAQRNTLQSAPYASRNEIQ